MILAIMRVLVLSDIHGNLAALESVLGAAAGRYDVIWCLGDIIGYGPRPNECVSIIREQTTICVMGNHDWAGLGRPGIDVESFNPQAKQAVLWTQKQLSEDTRAFLNELPVHPIHAPDYAYCLVTHASPREPVWEYVTTPSIAMENFALFHEQICLVGHTHKPAIYRWRLSAKNEQQVATVDFLPPQAGVMITLDTSAEHRLILNPGSVGQPRDNDARAAFAILDLEQMSWEYERVAYPIELTQSQMRAADLPRRLIDRLSFGW